MTGFTSRYLASHYTPHHNPSKTGTISYPAGGFLDETQTFHRYGNCHFGFKLHCLQLRAAGLNGFPSNPGNNTASPVVTAVDLQPLAGLLRPDGSLDLTTGFSGSLDPTGFSLGYAADGSPLFTPKAPLAPANTWHALGNGPDDPVEAIAVVDRQVYVGGYFSTIVGTVNTPHIAYWDAPSNNWFALGTGLNGSVMSIMVNGSELIAGGEFTATGDGLIPLNHIARWNGYSWSALGPGLNASV